MSRFAKLFAANAIAATGLCSAALALSSSAAADPVIPPAVPGVPGLDMIQQFATNPASLGAVLQTAATALNGASTMVGAPAPATLPVSPIEGAPGTMPGMPAAPIAPATAPGGAGSTLVPLLNQFGIPASLVNLAPTDLPFPLQLGGQSVASPAPVTSPIAPVTSPIAPVTSPIAPVASPIAPVASPVAPQAAAAPSGGANPLTLLGALP